VARRSQAGLVYTLIAGLADSVENGISWWVLGTSSTPDSSTLAALTAAAWAKWLSIGAGSAALVVSFIAAQSASTT
jgi:hypothetical protein